MNKLKLKKTLILGICFTALSSGIAFADGGGSQPSDSMLQVEEIKIESSVELPTEAPDQAVSYIVQESGEIDSEILQNQRDIDKYLFEDHFEEIEKLDFRVTHTGPFDNYVEIGITPYSEENADYLYEIFGKDKVKVVEGQQAELYSTAVTTSNQEVDLATTTVSKEEPKSNSLLTYIIGGLALLGAGIFTGRKLKTAK